MGPLNSFHIIRILQKLNMWGRILNEHAVHHNIFACPFLHWCVHWDSLFVCVYECMFRCFCVHRLMRDTIVLVCMIDGLCECAWERAAPQMSFLGELGNAAPALLLICALSPHSRAHTRTFKRFLDQPRCTMCVWPCQVSIAMPVRCWPSHLQFM